MNEFLPNCQIEVTTTIHTTNNLHNYRKQRKNHRIVIARELVIQHENKQHKVFTDKKQRRKQYCLVIRLLLLCFQRMHPIKTKDTIQDTKDREEEEEGEVACGKLTSKRENVIFLLKLKGRIVAIAKSYQYIIILIICNLQTNRKTIAI